MILCCRSQKFCDFLDPVLGSSVTVDPRTTFNPCGSHNTISPNDFQKFGENIQWTEDREIKLIEH